MSKSTVYERVTNQIIAAIERGQTRCKMPWHVLGQGLPVNVQSEATYRGVNLLCLWAVAEEKQYKDALWGTYKQWRAVGAQVKRGEKAAHIVFWNQREESKGETEESPKWFARAYQVFNLAQVEGWEPPERELVDEGLRCSVVDAYFQAIPVDLRHGGDRAFYSSKEDFIQLPELVQFLSIDHYYSTLAHELAHWTGAQSRLDRDLSSKHGSEAYAVEELVAELAAAFITAKLGIESSPREDHAGYIANWLTVLKSDARAIFSAASKAQEVADYLLAFSKKEEVVAA